MLIETLDLLDDDVVIYSENKFDLKENYKIIYKQSEIKRPQKIDYLEVCNFIRSIAPKNIIVYRLLTSVSSIDAYSTKYGYFLNTPAKMELVYFDPIFAIKDIDNLVSEINPSEFRFKVQQVGYTTAGEKNSECLYSEVYSFDLRAIEAQNQNDKVFAQAIFALDDSFIDDSDEDAVFIQNKEDQIVEDRFTKSAEFAEPNLSSARNKSDINEEKIKNLKKSFAAEWKETTADTDISIKKESDKEKSSFSTFIDKHKTKPSENTNKGIFTSDQKKKFADRDSVILRFK